MSKLSVFAKSLEDELKENIEEFWKEATEYGSVRLMDLGKDQYHFAYITKPVKIGKKFKASDAKGVYIWKHKNTVLYVGKTDAETTSVHSRQKSHIRSFEKPWTTSESSGRKYREYLCENDLDYLDVDILYIDTSDFAIKGIAELIENATIDFYKPAINSEVLGRGKRTAHEYVSN